MLVLQEMQGFDLPGYWSEADSFLSAHTRRITLRDLGYNSTLTPRTYSKTT